VLPDAETVRNADYSILFVGNSHTFMHDLPNQICQMIQFRHPDKSTTSHMVGVGFLEDVSHDPACRHAIETREWKHVVLQAQKISVSGSVDYSRKEGIELAKFAKTRGASVVFYPEWGLKGKVGDGARQEQVYREMAAAADVALAPVASAWDLAMREKPDLALHGPDGNHQSELGAFLTAAVLYGRLTGEPPTQLADFPYPHADAKQRKFLVGVAVRALDAKSQPK